MSNMSSYSFNSVDLKNLDIPDNIVSLSQSDYVIVKENTTLIDGNQVFYREGFVDNKNISSEITLILLHGMRFSSKTWLDLGTINLASSMGYRTIAVDLPGYGNSPSAHIADKAAFLLHLLEELHIKRPVVVSPSMSGSYTVPFLMKYHDTLCGYIPVAPIGTDILENLPLDGNFDSEASHSHLKRFLCQPIPNLKHITTPTMVVFGEKDCSRSSALLSLLPQSQCQMIPNGGHPAYLDDPDLWHQLLYNFLHFCQIAVK